MRNNITETEEKLTRYGERTKAFSFFPPSLERTTRLDVAHKTCFTIVMPRINHDNLD